MAPRRKLAEAWARKNPPNCTGGGLLGRMMANKKIKKEERKDCAEKMAEIRSAARKLRKEADCLDYAILQLVEQAQAKRKKFKELSAEADALSAEQMGESDGSDDE